MKIDALMRHYGKKHNTLLKFQALVNKQTRAFVCVCVPLEQHAGKPTYLFT